jgi:hypothetical protein
MEWRHQVAQEMTPKQRQMFFKLGSLISAANRGGPSYDRRAHELSLWALDQVNWKSFKAAKYLLVVSRKI